MNRPLSRATARPTLPTFGAVAANRKRAMRSLEHARGIATGLVELLKEDPDPKRRRAVEALVKQVDMASEEVGRR